MASAPEAPMMVETFRLEFMYDDVKEHTYSGHKSININQNWKEVMQGILNDTPEDYIYNIRRTPFSDDEHSGEPEGEPEGEPMLEGEAVEPHAERPMTVDVFKGDAINSELSMRGLAFAQKPQKTRRSEPNTGKKV
eukprot:s1252_g15.t1